MYAIIVNEDTKEVNVGVGTDEEYYKSIGMSDMEVEKAYDGNWFVKGYAPEKPQSKCEEDVRFVRNRYLVIYVDNIASNPLRWADMTEEEQNNLKNYRQYLLDYPETTDWWKQNPKTYEEWKL